MPKYAYVAVDSSGSTVRGVEDAETLARARVLLHTRDLHPTELHEKRSVLQFEITKEKLPRKELMHFSRQLAVFVRAGIPIIEGLEAIASEASDKVLRRTLHQMAEALRSGETFADAAAAHPEAFPKFFVSVLRSAELTGNLDGVLEQLAEYIERDLDARHKVTSALVYPAIIFVMAVITTVILTVWVLPRFEGFFDSLDAELPLATRMLLGISDFTSSWGWLVAAAGAAVVAGALLWFRTVKGRAARDRILLALPALGSLVRHAVLERFCRVLSSLVQAGVPLPDALAVTADVANNDVYRKGILEARDGMIRGEGLAGPLSATGLFPGAARQMFKVGEETGTLEDQLRTAADYFDRELDVRIKRFTAMFEPAVIVGVGLVVGFVAVAMISAMYGVFNQGTGL